MALTVVNAVWSMGEPIILSGGNLGLRHRCLNSQVNQAAISGQISLEDIETLPEQTPIDRLFKIELAIKLKNVDYILKNLKDDDMLYVSRALKCRWLLERSDIINPKYLENVLFPEMVMPAISKMKHWLYINLNEPLRCQEFYEHYKNIKFDFAVKFLRHCDNEFLLNEFPKILIQITPHYLKVFGEKCPKLVKIYYDSLTTNDELIKRYLKEKKLFHNNISCVLKADPDMFLDITEKYHLSSFNKLSPSATDYILSYRKNRFLAKVELYVVYLLHIPTVAKRLKANECQEIVMKLAQADYLSAWFSYANVEPLVKRVNGGYRATFKRLVFVQKDVGERVAEWPYALPASPVVAAVNSNYPHVFHDHEYKPIQRIAPSAFASCRSMRRSCIKDSYKSSAVCSMKSELQKLFDEFRFVAFESTRSQLRRRIEAASSADRRRDMFVVLVSKTRGRAELVRSFLRVALRFRNDPVHERAAVVRTLVTRASAWRHPVDVWEAIVYYGHKLGLKGEIAEAPCREGLHGIILRHFLVFDDCEPAMWPAFLNNFSTLVEYKLTSNERETVAAGLQSILITAAAEAEPEVAARYLNQLLDVLEKYHISYSAAVSPVVALSERDAAAARPLLARLYEARVGRAELLRQYLEFRHDDAALVNALRHDPGALKSEVIIKLLIDGKTRGNQFFLKLALYFSETKGVGEELRQVLLDKATHAPDEKLARPIAMLAGNDLNSIWEEHRSVGFNLFQQTIRDMTVTIIRPRMEVTTIGRNKLIKGFEQNKHSLLSAALQANMDRARPIPVLCRGLRQAGMKTAARRATRCRPSQTTQIVQDLLKEGDKRPVRLALALAPRTNCMADVFSTAFIRKPQSALRAALLYYRSLGEAADPRLWAIIRPYMSTLNLKRGVGLRHVLRNVDWLPIAVRPEYCATLYLVLDDASFYNSDYIHPKLMKYLPKLDDDLLDEVLFRVLHNTKMSTARYESYPAIVIRYLMLSKTADDQKSRFENIGEPFFRRLSSFYKKKDELSKDFFKENVAQIMRIIQYNDAFFDVQNQFCLLVIEKILTWLQIYLAKDIFFEQYVKIHATMSYYKAVRQSIKQHPEIFQDPAKKMCEGVYIVGYTLGIYIVKDVVVLRAKYFDSILELYRGAFIEYLKEYFLDGPSKVQFVAAVIKGMLAESVGSESRLAFHVFCAFRSSFKGAVSEEINQLMMKNGNKELQFFLKTRAYE